MSVTVTSSLSEETQVNTSDPEGPKPGVHWASAVSVRTAAGSVALRGPQLWLWLKGDLPARPTRKVSAKG